MRLREVILLFFIIVVGVFFFHARTGKLGFEWDEFIDFGWNDYTYEETQVIEPPLPAALSVLNAHGRVEIQGVETDRISVTFEKRVWRRTEDKAREVADKLHPVVRREEARLVLTTNREDFPRRNFETSFRLSVPAGIPIQVRNSHGEVRAVKVGAAEITNPHGRVSASQVSGELLIDNSHEEVEVEDVFARCVVTSRHADVSVKRVSGDLEVKDSHGLVVIEEAGQKVLVDAIHTEIEGSDLAGPLDITSSYEPITLRRVGPTKIQARHAPIDAAEVNGDLEITDSYETVRLTSVRGKLSVSGKNMPVIGSDIHGAEISISTSYEDVELDAFEGRTTILNAHGKVSLTPLPLTGSIEVRCTSSPIFFFWPEGHHYPFEAQTKHAEIDWRLEGGMEVEETDGLTVARAYTGLADRPSIRLITTYGDILIEKSPLR